MSASYRPPVTVEEFLEGVHFALPGWDRGKWYVEDGGGGSRQLTFEWTLPHSTPENPRDVTIRIVHPVRDDMPLSELERIAWWCVRVAVLHEAGEHFWSRGERPWHPHKHKWWEIEHKAGPSVLEKAGPRT